MSSTKEQILLGAHTSAAGGAYNALLEGRDIGATTIQLFTANQKRWEGKPLAPKDVDLWTETLKETGLTHVMSHDSYLINLGSPGEETLEKSRRAFKDEIERCKQLNITYLNFHPGAALKDTPEACMDRIVESLLEVEELLEGSSLRLLLEATAGQGSNVGYRFEHLAYIIERTEKKIPVGVCIDTCHIFAAGYDLRTPEAFDATLKEFDSVVGLKKLYALHVNDSMKPLGSRVDRHQHLGEGEIGWECFRCLMNDPRTRHLPKYLETPGGTEYWTKEIKQLKAMVK